MPSDPETDGEDEDEPSNYREYRRSKNPRFSEPEDARRESQDGTGEASGFDEILDAEGDTAKSVQEQLAEVVGEDWNPLGADESRDTEPADLSWSEEDFDDPPTEAELLADIRDQLNEMDAPEQALRSARQSTTVEKNDPVAMLEAIEAELELIEAAEEAAEAFVEAGHSLSDPLSEFVPFLRDSLPNDADAENQSERHERGRALARLAGLENQAEDDESPA